MRKWPFVFVMLVILSAALQAQDDLRVARQQSWQSFVYRIAADTAEKYIRTGDIAVEVYAEQQPFAVWKKGADKPENLPAGNYVIVSVEQNELVTKYYCKSNVQLMPVNDQHMLQLELRDTIGNPVVDAKLWLNGRLLNARPSTSVFKVKRYKNDGSIAKVVAGSDTSFFELEALEDFTQNRWSQWWTNVYYSQPVYFVASPYRFAKRMVRYRPAYWFPRKYNKGQEFKGYVVFNQPKYKPGDTLRMKAFVVNKKGRAITQEVNLSLSYFSRNKYFTKIIGHVKPRSPGSYTYDFVLGDSLEADRRYQLNLVNRKGDMIIGGVFAIEDYLLDEVANYTLRSDKQAYYNHDTLNFYAAAKDANGLSIMDGRVKCYLLAKNIRHFYSKQVIVPDTLWQQEKPMNIEADTHFEVPAAIFPAADMDIDVVMEFKNSNNEIHEKDITVTVSQSPLVIDAMQQDGYITAVLLRNGLQVTGEGLLSYDDNTKRAIKFPFREKINPFVTSYLFWVENDSGRVTVTTNIDIEKNGEVAFSRLQRSDSAGFSLYNPLGALVHYAVMFGNRTIISGSDTSRYINWLATVNERKAYRLHWNYLWGGKEYKDSRTIALLSKLMTTEITGATHIYPGQNDSIILNVTDYKGRPVENVNLTALSYNSQFSNDIKIPEPPYLQKFKSRRVIKMDAYESQSPSFTVRRLLGNHPDWKRPFGLDSMLYYRFLFPLGGKLDVPSYITDFVPQLAVHAVEKGVPQEIYLLYINRNLVWFNGVTDKSSYAFQVPPGYTQIAFRLKDKYIELDSVYVQPYYKHDIVFDIDQLPPGAKILTVKDSWSFLEQRLLEQQLFRISNDRVTNNGYIWQNNRLVLLNKQIPHIVGPFQAGDSLQFFKPGAFDLKFAFEPAYEYTLTPHMARLEQKTMFLHKAPVKLTRITKTNWILGDTLTPIPAIQYEKTYTSPWLWANDYNHVKNDSTGTVKIELPADSSIAFAVLYSINEDTTITKIRDKGVSRFENVQPGIYQLALVTKNQYFLDITGIKVVAASTTCVKANEASFQQTHLFLQQLHQSQYKQLRASAKYVLAKPFVDTTYTPVVIGLPLPTGSSAINGVITDREGKAAIPGAIVTIKGYNSGVVADEKGRFMISGIKQGVYVLRVSAIGYEAKEVKLNLQEGERNENAVELVVSRQALNEVVVVGYGVTKKSNLTGSVTVVAGEQLMGAIAGVTIRGQSSLAGNTKPLYVVNGVVLDELPTGINMDNAQMSVLNGEVATAIYGARAASGAIVIITEDFSAPALRSNFKDYAIWQPDLVTNKSGKTGFTVTYPDNITSWQTVVIGMDQKKRITKASAIVRSFKPMLAQLSMPRFLIEGDEATVVGKLTNYSNGTEEVTATFTVNNNTKKTVAHVLKSKAAYTEPLPIIATGDSARVQYDMKMASGYADGELRTIPILKKGTEEAHGVFSILNNDTTITYIPDTAGSNTVLYIQYNPVDVLLDELKRLKDYPYFCVEQMASKLTGLLLEKQIYGWLKQPFKQEKDIQQLLQKIQKAQLFNGSWSWWPGGDASLDITTYTTRALLPFKADPLLQTNLRNATLYLQQQLPRLSEQQLPDVLYTLSEAGHVMDYSVWLQRLRFDSLSIHGQWLVIAIKQQQQMSYKKEWQVVMQRKVETMLGGLHWGEDSYWWQHNAIATTVLAYQVLQRVGGNVDYQKRMMQYFLEERRRGCWRNTFESASICASILPLVMETQPGFQSKPQVTIHAASTTVIDKFPYGVTLNQQTEPITITKQGGGMMYLTAWQRLFNAQPKAVTDNFVIDSRFEKEGKTVMQLQAGEKTVMKVNVKALKDAAYVLIEIPIPAGCTYAANNRSGLTHQEFLKDKMVVFVESMPKGDYEYSIELEPRYAGTYHVNPVKVELMYFATFYGRNQIKQVIIKPEEILPAQE